MAFHRSERPDCRATSPAAVGGLRRARRPIMNSAARSGVAMRPMASTKTRMNALPPEVPARYGNLQMLPSPTAAPTTPR